MRELSYEALRVLSARPRQAEIVSRFASSITSRASECLAALSGRIADPGENADSAPRLAVNRRRRSAA